MPIKSRSNCSAQKNYDYPKLMILNSLVIVLFSSDGEGVVVESGGNKSFRVGEWSDGWTMPNFKDYHGDVTLTNC